MRCGSLRSIVWVAACGETKEAVFVRVLLESTFVGFLFIPFNS